MINEITVQELKQKLDAQEPVLLIDVREPDERMVSNIGGLHIPLHTLLTQVYELEEHKNDAIVVYCRSGARSANATAFLLSVGFINVFNLKGGMKAWKEHINPDMPVA